MQKRNRGLQCPLHRLLHYLGHPEARKGCRGKIARQAEFPRFVPAPDIRDIIWKSLSRLGVGRDFRNSRSDNLINRL